MLEYPLGGVHPLAILREIDLIDSIALSPGGGNVTLQTLKHEVQMTYNETYGDLYVLSDGSLRPLKEVAFPHGPCWYTIEITRLGEPGVGQSERNATSEVMSDHIIAFLEQELFWPIPSFMHDMRMQSDS